MTTIDPIAPAALANLVGDLGRDLPPAIVPVITMSAAERDRTGREHLDRLRARGLVTADEAERLFTLLHELNTNTAKPTVFGDVVGEFDATAAGPVALAIAHATLRSAVAVTAMDEPDPERGEVLFDIGDTSTAGGCACLGGIVGATAGAILGGPAGAVAGAAAGAIGGAVGFNVAEALL